MGILRIMVQNNSHIYSGVVITPYIYIYIHPKQPFGPFFSLLIFWEPRFFFWQLWIFLLIFWTFLALKFKH